MNWGVNKADNLGVQSFIEATELGRHLYEKYEFVLVSIDTVDTNVPNPSEDWKDMERRFKANPWCVIQASRDSSRLLTFLKGTACGGLSKEITKKGRRSFLGKRNVACAVSKQTSSNLRTFCMIAQERNTVSLAEVLIK